MTKKYAVFLIFMLTTVFAAAQKTAWADIEKTAETHLENLLAINTSQPDGNELGSVRYIYKVLNDYNIDWEIYQPEKNRASISAVIKGSDHKKEPLMLLSHLDTVSPGTDWTKMPFKATVEDGKIYGLGSSDDKNNTAIYLTLITWLKKNNITPERDIIFLATADEEAGSVKGLKWLINSEYWKNLKPGFALNEGGSVILEDGKPPVVFVEAATKMYMDIKITAYGAAGHSSDVGGGNNNAVYNLTQALSKIEKLKMPYELTPFVKNFFRSVLPAQDEDAKTTINIMLSGTPAESVMAADIAAEDPFFKTQLQDTLTPTVLTSGAEANVTAGEASAILNCRLLPSTNPDVFVQRITKLFEGDDTILIEVLDKPDFPFPQPSSGADELFTSITKAANTVFENPSVLLGMTPASSDSEFLRRAGVTTYGIGAPANGVDEGRPHSPDEYIEEDSFSKQLQFFFNSVYNFTVPNEPISNYIE
ncbi:MAG: M20/M25/M40 family metallo-hydrolase [Elusimicrobia bacterium]|nr:M20/M25/M40 family metallo-hydrolase [Elusimicrobiota bacterium]